MAGGKLTRKEIVQQDVIRKTLTEGSHWAIVHLKWIVGAAGALTLAVLLILAWQSYSSSRQRTLQSGFGEAMAIFHAPVGPVDPSSTPASTPVEKYRFETEQERSEKALAAFQELWNNHPGTTIGRLSQYYAGLSLHQLGRTDEATQTLRALAAESSTTPEIRNLARHSLAEILLSEGATEEGTGLLEAILTESSSSFPSQLILLRLADVKERSGDVAGALELYRRISTEHAGTSAASEASTKVRRLEPRVGGTESSTAETPSAAAEQP